MTQSRALGDRAIPLCISLCVACVAYFYALDRLLFSSANFSPIFKFLLIPDAVTAWVELGICCLAVLWRRPAPVLRCVALLGEHPAGTALAAAALFAVAAIGVYHDYPLSMDEYAAVFQAKIFASGHITAHLPPSYLDWLVVRGFNGEFLVASHQTGKAIEQYWPGFALLLAPFQFFRVPWLCNALLGGAALFLIHWITNEVTQDRRAAGWALLFALASGALAADSISYYSMQAHLTANLLFVALLLRPSRYRALAAGLVGSLALILHNPVPHSLFAIPWLIVLVWDRNRWQYLPPLILGYLPGLSIGIGWLLLRSDIGAAAHPLGWGALAGGAFTWPTAAVLNIRAATLAKLWVWSSPGLLVLAGVGWSRQREKLAVNLMGASAVLTFMGYLFVAFDQGHGWGNRYFYSAWGVVPIMAAAAMSRPPEASLRLVCFAGAAACLSLLIVVPLQFSQIEHTIARHLAQLGPPRRPGNNVYFIHPQGGFYVADMVQIDPLHRSPDLYLVSRGVEWDTHMVLNNWPGAVRTGATPAFDQWYLGPQDQRRPSGLIPPTAADR